MAIITKHGIKVVSYVHTARGLVDCDELTPEEKMRLGTELKKRWLNELFRGRAVFYEAEDGATEP